MSVETTLEQIDLMAGSDPWHSIPRLEAIWPKDGRISWREAYDAAQARFPFEPERTPRIFQEGHEHMQHHKRVAFLEGILTALREEREV